MLWLVCMDVGYTVVMSVGRVSSVKVRSEKNGVGETARSKRMNRFSSTTKHGCELEIIIIATRKCVYRHALDSPATSPPCHCGWADLTS